MLLNPTNDTIPIAWYPEPSFRGTYSLLSSWVSTLLLCVLSAVHLDVPSVNHSKLHRWATKFKWVAVGIFAPEWLSMIAWIEWKNARAMVIEANKHLIQAGKATSHTAWDLTQGFYASTGGFSAKYSDKEATLTATGVLYLIKEDADALRKISTISSKDIRDKSKQDSISKCLALVQVLWFGAQCITRLVQGLPVSLLELNTVVHTLYAFITYGFWWNKPFDVDVPHTITITSDAVWRNPRPDHNISQPPLTTKEISKPLCIRFSWRYLIYGANPFQVDEAQTVSSRNSVIVPSFFGALYGALHLAAWNSSFPTPLECFLWHISTLCIILCGVVVSISQVFVIRIEKAKTGCVASRALLLVLNLVTSYSILF
ncbi:uncharacterized protein STEHIDRAFT_68846 [Stereum hirsutum FP-91666 SS1]|uniref:Uncharacterized protein n=1 Tax=Stereum hirsutum (strain FP-91666) TaxID=721885 RepID=R7RXA6_STEHR|nr:uncharacterized protein STEHIDRAFT_68846 [Stereum hirsutum FP-91666 SS1]EIM80021.1 hypothetical protein STEHIDRAFT_68846 [Stereum hirsutum FP-91666 SS1]